jgi:hypothetical protein
MLISLENASKSNQFLQITQQFKVKFFVHQFFRKIINIKLASLKTFSNINNISKLYDNGILPNF